MRTILFVCALVLLTATAALAEDAGTELNQDWVALNVQLGHVQKALAAYVAEAAASKAKAEDMESRLKWVLDNWAGK